jgi:hypothetical protein
LGIRDDGCKVVKLNFTLTLFRRELRRRGVAGGTAGEPVIWRAFTWIGVEVAGEASLAKGLQEQA